MPFLTFVANKSPNGDAANYSFVLRGYVRHWLGNVWGEYDRVKLNDIIAASAPAVARAGGPVIGRRSGLADRVCSSFESSTLPRKRGCREARNVRALLLNSGPSPAKRSLRGRRRTELGMAQQAPLYIIASPRPRVGKTLIARLMIEFFRSGGRGLTGYDLDPREPALAGRFPRWFGSGYIRNTGTDGLV